MLLKCPGDDKSIKLFSWCKKGPRTFSINVAPSPATARMRGADGYAPHIRYTCAAMEWAQISGATGFSKRTDTKLIVDMDCGTHTFQRPGTIELVGGNPATEINLTALDEHDLQVPDGPSWHALTRLVVAGATVNLPDWHTRIGGWSPRAVTLEGEPFLPSAFPVACIPGTELVNGAGQNLMIFTLWRG